MVTRRANYNPHLSPNKILIHVFISNTLCCSNMQFGETSVALRVDKTSARTQRQRPGGFPHPVDEYADATDCGSHVCPDSECYDGLYERRSVQGVAIRIRVPFTRWSVAWCPRRYDYCCRNRHVHARLGGEWPVILNSGLKFATIPKNRSFHKSALTDNTWAKQRVEWIHERKFENRRKTKQCLLLALFSSSSAKWQTEKFLILVSFYVVYGITLFENQYFRHEYHFLVFS